MRKTIIIVSILILGGYISVFAQGKEDTDKLKPEESPYSLNAAFSDNQGLATSSTADPQSKEGVVPAQASSAPESGDTGNLTAEKQSVNPADELEGFEAKGTAQVLSAETASFKKVTAIEIKGNKSISANNIISKMKTRIGSPYQENIVSDDLKRLYLLGFFSDIKADTEDYKDGIKIILTVVERPIIEKITFDGIHRLTMKEEKLKESLKSKETQYLDYPNISEDARTLQKMYEKIGYSQAKVDYKVDINKETGKAKVQFNINEGLRVRVKDIEIEGNKAFPQGRILKLMKTKRAWFFNAGVLKDDVLKEDIERIKSFYRKEGFADIEVNYEVKTDPKKPFLYIMVRVKEGKKYLVGNITVQGNEKIDRKDILGRLKACVPGKVFSQESLKQDISNIQSLYFDRGYIFAQIQDATSLNPYTGCIDIIYNIVENDVAYVDKIKIRGNVKTRDMVIRRELRIKPGDKFDGDKLRRSKERLQNLGFFEEVNYDTEDTTAPNKKDLVVEVKESKTGAFSFGGGYSSVDKLVGFVEIEQKNFDWRNFPYFTGGGQNLKLRAAIGSVSDSYSLSFTEPWMFDYPVTFGFDAYKNTHKRESDIGYGYDEDITGGDLRLGRELSEYIRADLTYRYDNIKIDNITDNASNELKKEEGTNVISSAELVLTYDSRDNVFDPTRGDVLTNNFTYAGGIFSGDKDFYKYSARASHYIGLFNGSVLEAKLRVGLADTYGDSDDVPIYERFFAGGAYTIRGYEERKVGPIDKDSKDPLGGKSMLIGNLEYTYPIFSFLKLAAFYDVGNVWDKIKDIGSSKDYNDVNDTGGFKSGIGLGVRVRTPIGPIMLDYGYPLDKAPGEDRKSTGRLHFSMSHGF
ncbi:MAG: outer membrane protein assembly factor BamA [Candidatus Omnitrophota bacterium]